VIKTCFTVALSLCTFNADCATQDTLQEHFVRIVGEESELLPSPTVHEAAQQYIIGRQYLNEEKYGNAIVHFKKAVELDNNAYAPWVGLALALSETGRLDTALSIWREVLARNPSHGEALLIVGLDDARLGDIEIAKRRLAKRWLQNQDAEIESLLRDSALLVIFEAQNNQEVLNLINHEFQLTFDAAVTTLINQNNHSNWIGVLQQLVDVGAAPIASRVVSAASFHVNDRIQSTLLTALPLLEIASFGDGSLTEQVYTKVSLTKEIPLAPRWFEPVTLAEALSMAAQSMSMFGVVDAPIKLYESSITLDSSDALTMNNLAWMKLNRDGVTEEVEELCTKAYALDNTAPYILDTVGWMHVQNGEPQKAVPLFLEALRITEQPSPETYVHLGDAYWQINEPENAIVNWRIASSILSNPETKKAYIEGFMSMAHSIWGISVATPEALYDLELGETTRKVMETINAYESGNYSKVSELIEIDGAN
jgi:tetratricopeptide (TPR) repeat protein